MRSPWCILCGWFAAVIVAALPAVAESPPPARAVRLLSLLPKFDPQSARPQPSAPDDAARLAAPLEKDGVVILPDYTVVEKKVAEPRADDWIASDAITRREIRRLEADMTTLELLLNRWPLPLVSASFGARARSRYESQRFRGEITRVLDLAQAVETFDPRAAAELRSALDFRKLPKEGGK